MTPLRVRIVCQNQKSAITTATCDAQQEAWNTGLDSTAVVLLVNGDAMYITAKPGEAKVSRKVSSGWPLTGPVFFSRTIEDIVQ